MAKLSEDVTLDAANENVTFSPRGDQQACAFCISAIGSQTVGLYARNGNGSWHLSESFTAVTEWKVIEFVPGLEYKLEVTAHTSGSTTIALGNAQGTVTDS